MVFSSVIFLFAFLPAVLAFYFLVRNQKTLRNVVLLSFSLFFYFWGEGTYIWVILAYVLVNYSAGRIIESLKARELNGGTRWSRVALVCTIVFDLSLLVFYKYINFLLGNVAPFLQSTGLDVSVAPIHLPIGISFFTFQAMSYAIDVYRDDTKATRSLPDFALYIVFFPQLIAGPIVRYVDVARQVVNRTMSREMFYQGTQRFITGLAKKVIIANTAAVAADRIFQVPAGEMPLVVAWLGVVCYSLQIYFDFSGYSDMAIGMGKMFGFDFLENFNYPYVAQSIKDFWRRWHISLSTWFRDYLYIPLGGNRGPAWRVHFNLILVFFLCGLWHGASWTFVIWGLWHGCFLVLERTAFDNWLEKAWMPVRSMYTLGVVAVGWVFFRADTLTYALQYLGAMVGLAEGNSMAYPLQAYMSNDLLVALALGVLFSMPVASILKNLAPRYSAWIGNWGRAASWANSSIEAATSSMYLAVFAFCSMLLVSGTHNPFIYFRF